MRTRPDSGGRPRGTPNGDSIASSGCTITLHSAPNGHGKSGSMLALSPVLLPGLTRKPVTA